MAPGQLTKECDTSAKIKQFECNSSAIKSEHIFKKSAINNGPGRNYKIMQNILQSECKLSATKSAQIMQCWKRGQNESKQSATQSATKSAINNGPSGIDKIMQNERNPSAIRLQFEYNVKKECNYSQT
jgi:hypothetical protein